MSKGKSSFDLSALSSIDIADYTPPAFTSEQLPLYTVLGLLTAAIPAYLFHSVYTVDFVDHALIYAGIILLTALILAAGYGQTHSNAAETLTGYRLKNLSGSIKKYNKTRLELETQQTSVTHWEALLWSVFLNNTLFTASFFFLVYYVFAQVDLPYAYSSASVIAAAVAWQAAGAISNIKQQ